MPVRSLGEAFLTTVRRRPFAFAMADPNRGPLTWLKAAAGAVALARALRSSWTGQRRVGILLPPSVPGALVNAAAALGGRVTINLNYSIGRSAMEAAIAKAQLQSVVTSRLFLEKGKLEPPQGATLVFLEDLAKTITSRDRVVALLFAVLAPRAILDRFIGTVARPGPEDVTTIIFSSGSTGDPKGVPLTHANLLSNIDAAFGALKLTHRDRIAHILPFFHAYGNFLYWAGVKVGAGLAFAPNPLDAVAIGNLVERYDATLICATPTFLQMYRKRVPREKFRSLKIIIAGAEKLAAKAHEALNDYFDGAVLEGYGCTECAPVVAVNLPEPGGTKRGSVGRPLPGVSVRVVDPDTATPLSADQPGMLLVKGPNVMAGYLDADDLTSQVLEDGWYTTGDIAAVDASGFITISDRLSRFSKIGGEMVPHSKVEDALHEVAGVDVPSFAVTSIHDERRGEALAVVHVVDDDVVTSTLERLRDSDLPNLFIPKASHFVRVAALPMLGSGKLDLRAVRVTAEQQILQSVMEGR